MIATPFNSSSIDEAERMDPAQLVRDIRARGNEAFNWPDATAIATMVAANAQPADVVAILSNGGFDGLHDKLIERLQQRFSST